MWQAQGIYSEYVLRTPLILSGREAIKELYNYPAARIAIIHGSNFNDRELFDVTFKKKEKVYISRSWKQEPDLENIKATLNELQTFQPDTIIAVGGGSLIDGVKLCRLFYELPYFELETDRIDGGSLKTKFIVIPTLIGSGAEVSSAAVYVKDGRKQMMVSPSLQPDVVVYDPRYLEDLSKERILAALPDIFAHILEGYVSNVNNRLISFKAEEGLYILNDETNKLLNDKAADFLRLQYASYIGGIVQNHCIVGAAHAIAHQLSDHYSHAEAVALLLPAAIRMNMKDETIRSNYERICEHGAFENTEELITLLEKINEISGIAGKKKEIRELLISKENDKTFMSNIREDRGGKGNPVMMSDEYLKELFRSI